MKEIPNADRQNLIIERLARAAKKRGEATAETDAKKRLEEMVEKRKRANIAKPEERWAKKAQSNKQEEHNEAVNEARRGAYIDKQLEQAQVHFESVKAKAPKWVLEKPLTNSASFEFAAQIAELPPGQQNNPAVLLKKTAEFYYSVDWIEMPSGAHAEARELLSRAYKEIVRLQSDTGTAVAELQLNTPEDVKFAIDRGIDVYKTMPRVRIDLISDEPPVIPYEDRAGQKRTRIARKGDPEYKQWQEERARQLQQENLDHFLRETQRELDNPENRGYERQDEILDGAYKELHQKIKGPLFRPGQMRAYSGKDAEPYIERIKVSRNFTEAAGEAEKEEKGLHIYEMRNEAEADRRVKELEKQGSAHKWTKEDAERFPKSRLNVGDVIHLRGEFSPEDIKLIISGKYKDREKWVSQFWQDIFTHGMEPDRPEITDQYKWNAFEGLLDRINPGEYQYEKYAWKELYKTLGSIDAVAKGVYFTKDPKYALENLKFIRPRELQLLFKNFEHSEKTYALYKETMMDLLARRMAQFQTVVDNFRGPVSGDELSLLAGNPKLDGLRRKYDVLIRGGKRPTRDMFLKDLQDLYAERNSSGDVLGFGDLSGPVYDKLMKLQEERDITGRGVYLQESDMTANYSQYKELVDLHQEYEEIKRDLGLVPGNATYKEISDTDRQKLRERISALEQQMKDGWKILSGNPFDDRIVNHDELTAVSGYSPVEIQLRDRLILYFRNEEGLDTEEKLQPWLKENEWKIRNAVFAARYASYGWGDALDIAARVVRAPTLDLDSAVTETTGADVMPGTFAEPIIRILNKDLFEDRFRMQGSFGDEIRNIYYPTMFRVMSPDFVQNMPQHFKDMIREKEKQGKPVYKIYIRAAEDYFGIPWSEMLRSGFLHTGLHTTNTTWRTDIAFLEAYREHMMQLKRDHSGRADWIIDNQGLSMQFARAKNVSEKKSLLEKMVGRTPSRFLQLLGKDTKTLAAAHGIDLGGLEWQRFQTALSNAQMSVWSDERGFNIQKINFCDENDASAFNTILLPHLKTAGITDGSRHEAYRGLLVDLMKFAKRPDNGGRTMIDKWSEHAFPLTLPIIDFNVKNARVDLLNGYSNVRRINDMNTAAETSQLHFKLLDGTLMSPAKDYTKFAEALKEYRNTISSYDDPKVAERAAGAMAEVFMGINMDRTMYNVLGWLPLSKQIMRMIAEADIRWIKKTKHNKFLNSITGGDWEHLADHSIVEWPHTVARAISISTKYTGEAGWAMHANEIASFVSTLEKMSVFTELRNIPQDLRSRAGAGIMKRMFYHLPRRFWWVIPVAAISVGVALAMEEQKKEPHH